jgi:hypothetical protein
MRRILLVLSVAALVVAMMVASAMPAFAQGRGEGPQGEARGPEGGNPGKGGCQHITVGAREIQPLPFGGTEPEAGFENAPPGVVFTSPGSPFSAANPSECPE